MLVILNWTRLNSNLTKKYNSICYHAVREAVAMNDFLIGHISALENYSYLLTKVTYGVKRVKLASGVMWDFYDYSV